MSEDIVSDSSDGTSDMYGCFMPQMLSSAQHEVRNDEVESDATGKCSYLSSDTDDTLADPDYYPDSPDIFSGHDDDSVMSDGDIQPDVSNSYVATNNNTSQKCSEKEALHKSKQTANRESCLGSQKKDDIESDTTVKCSYLRSATDDTLADPDFYPDSPDIFSVHDGDSVMSDGDIQPDVSNSYVATNNNTSQKCGEKEALHKSKQTANRESCLGSRKKDKAKKLLLFRKRTRKDGHKLMYDKCHFCTFCGTKVVSKISRHLVTVHKDKEAIKSILDLPKGSRQRNLLLQTLVNEGNFKHNTSVIRRGEGEVVVGRRSSVISKNPSDYTACEFCKKWEARKNLWRHTKSCLARKEYYMKHPVETEGNSSEKRILAVKRGESLVNHAIFSGKDDEAMAELLSRMRSDEIKDIVVADELICHEVSLRVCALGKKEDQKNDDIYRVSQAARTLGRIVAYARETQPGISLNGLLCPEKFDDVVEIAKRMSINKENPALTVGKQIGYLLTTMCQSKYCFALRAGDRKSQEDATDFSKLISREWNSLVNRTALKRSNTEKRSQVKVIPLTEDLQTFRHYIMQNIRKLSESVNNRPYPADWVLLAKFTMCRLILFNKRRRAEVRELKVDEYLARPQWNSDPCGELTLALSSTDRLLAQR